MSDFKLYVETLKQRTDLAAAFGLGILVGIGLAFVMVVLSEERSN